MSEEVKVYSYRWAVLLVFGLAFMIGQMMWLAFSLIRNEVTPVLGLAPGDPGVVLLTASQPLAFILLSIPVGMLADRKGLVYVAGFGTILQAIFGTLRIFVINDFLLIFICQFGLSIGSVLVQNCIVYLSVNWFPKVERALATGVSTLFMLLGMLLGTALSMLLWTAPLYGDAGFSVALAQANVESILYLDAIMAIIITVLFFAVARDKPPHPPDVELTVTTTPSIRGMLKDRNVWIISFGFFAGFSIFIGLTAIIEELLLSLGIPVTAGLGSPAIVMILLLVSGIIGAILVPAISEKFQRRKPFLIACVGIAAVGTFFLGTSTIIGLTFLMSAVLGFFLIAVMPIGLSMLEELDTVGPELSGASTGLAFWFGNLGGFSGSILLEVFRVGPSYFYSIVYLVVIILVATLLMFVLPETGKRKSTPLVVEQQKE
ncbi:MAG: MFS transporter [Candidatus Thorarchaeota archaeon]|nr:MFS transporter [Candidatus Thorarchaeota archaeon]MCK5239406.1 MFS transporter [Candidatus Thorarchaeota archaeon]